MMPFNRSPHYLKFERVNAPEPMQPRHPSASVAGGSEPEAKFRNAGCETNPCATLPLSDAGATERSILRQIRDALKAAK